MLAQDIFNFCYIIGQFDQFIGPRHIFYLTTPASVFSILCLANGFGNELWARLPPSMNPLTA